MKKIIFAAAIISSFAMAHATEVGVSAVYDQVVSSNGLSVSVGGFDVAGFKAGVALSGVRNAGVGYDEIAVTAEKQVFSVGPVVVAGKTSIGYVERTGTTDRTGYVMNLGANATYQLTNSLDAVITFERRFGQRIVNDLNGNMVAVGIVQKF